MKIYTRSGDKGSTSLFGGKRVSKAESRVEVYGEIDELNACLGRVVALTANDPAMAAFSPLCVRIQRELFALGGEVACPHPAQIRHTLVGTAEVERLEREIDAFDAGLPPLKNFILPGGSLISAELHICRTVCRRAERSLVSAVDDSWRPVVLEYTNRLSDWFFIAARHVNGLAGVQENIWP